MQMVSLAGRVCAESTPDTAVLHTRRPTGGARWCPVILVLVPGSFMSAGGVAQPGVGGVRLKVTQLR